MIRLLFTLFKRFGAQRREKLLRVLWLTLAILCFSTSGFMFFELENKPDLSWSDALWWAVVTTTTVGYGDLFPSSPGGRFVIGFPTMIFGISVLGYLLSTVAGFLLEARSKELKGMADVEAQGHILVIHFPSVDRVLRLLDELAADRALAHKRVVLIDDKLEENPPELVAGGVKLVAGHPTKEATLERASFRQASHAILLAKDPNDVTSDSLNLAAALTLEQLHPDIVTVAECVDPESIPLLTRAGANSVVCLADMAASVLISEVRDPGVMRVLVDLVSSGEGQQLYLVPASGVGSFKAVMAKAEAQGALALGLVRGARVMLNPGADCALEPGDQAICVASSRPAAISS